MTEKEIAKEILLALIDNSYITVNEFPGADPVEMVCQAYKKIFKAVYED